MLPTTLTFTRREQHRPAVNVENLSSVHGGDWDRPVTVPRHQESCRPLFQRGGNDGAAAKSGDLDRWTLVQDHHVRLVLEQASESPFVIGRAAPVASTFLADDSAEPADLETVYIAEPIIEEVNAAHPLEFGLLLCVAEEVVVAGDPDHPPEALGEGPPDTPNVPRCAPPVRVRRGVEVASEHHTNSRGVGHNAGHAELGERFGEMLAKQLSSAVTNADPLQIRRRQDALEWFGQRLNERSEEREIHRSTSLVASRSRQIAPGLQRCGINSLDVEAHDAADVTTATNRTASSSRRSHCSALCRSR